MTVSTVTSGGGMGMRTYGGGVVEPWDTKSVLNDIVKDIANDRGTFAQYKVGVANPAAHLRKHILVIHPEFAIMLQRLGFTSKQSLRDYLYENTMVPFEELTIPKKYRVSKTGSTPKLRIWTYSILMMLSLKNVSR